MDSWEKFWRSGRIQDYLYCCDERPRVENRAGDSFGMRADGRAGKAAGQRADGLIGKSAGQRADGLIDYIYF